MTGDPSTAAREATHEIIAAFRDDEMPLDQVAVLGNIFALLSIADSLDRICDRLGGSIDRPIYVRDADA